jgi:hypothetical protein
MKPERDSGNDPVKMGRRTLYGYFDREFNISIPAFCRRFIWLRSNEAIQKIALLPKTSHMCPCVDFLAIAQGHSFESRFRSMQTPASET